MTVEVLIDKDPEYQAVITVMRISGAGYQIQKSVKHFERTYCEKELCSYGWEYGRCICFICFYGSSCDFPDYAVVCYGRKSR